jgi:hypothetical protein
MCGKVTTLDLAVVVVVGWEGRCGAVGSCCWVEKEATWLSSRLRWMENAQQKASPR